MSGTEKMPEGEEKKVSEGEEKKALEREEKKVSERGMDKTKNRDVYNLNNAVRRASDVLKSVALGRDETEQGDEVSSSDTVQN